MTASNQDTSALGTTILGRYRVVRALATGGMGTVYLARNEGAAGFVKPVVIKRSLRLGNERAGQMFAREARILSNLRHPGIVGIVDFAEEDGDYAMVLDYVHGYTLAEWNRFVRKVRGGLPVLLAVHALLRVLEALEYAHGLCDSSGKRLGIVHRDVKPSNVLVDVQGLVKLADFGIARTNTEATDTTTGDATLKGTFAFMAPELFGGEAPSRCSDVFSAAVTGYHLISGRNPFTTKDAALTAARTMQHEPDSLDTRRADVSAELARVIAKGMCKHPDGRYQTAADLASALAVACPGADDAELEFRAAIERDFTDPRFAELLGTDTLAEREHAWSSFGDPTKETRIALPLAPADLEATEVAPVPVARDLPTEPDVAPPRLDSHTAQTVALEGGVRQPAESAAAPRGSRTMMMFAALVVVAGAAVAIAFALGGSGKQTEAPAAPTVVMVRGDVTMEADAAAVAPSPDAGARAKVTRPVRAQPKAAPSAAAVLTATFRKRQGDIAACFDRYPKAASEAGALAVRFHIDEAGTVVGAELLPGAVASTPLGTCLLAVATATRFGAQDTPVSFRIPIRVRDR